MVCSLLAPFVSAWTKPKSFEETKGSLDTMGIIAALLLSLPISALFALSPGSLQVGELPG